MYKQAGAALITTSLLLAGCGGGGGGTNLTYDGPTAGVDITSATEGDSIAGTIISVESGSSVLTDAATIIPIGVSVTTGTTSTTQFSPSNLGGMAKKYAEMAMSSGVSSPELLAGISDSATFDCTWGGTATFSVSVSTVVDNEWVPTSGDTFTMSFKNCIEGNDIDGYEKANGKAKLVLNTFDYDQATQTMGDFSASFTFSNLKITDPSSGDYKWINGGYTAAFTGDGSTTPLQISLNGTSLVAESMTANVTHQLQLTDFSFVDTFALTGEFTFDHDYTIASTQLGGSVTVEMTTPFTLYSGDDYPTTGVVVVTGNNNASIKLSAVDKDTATIEYDLDADGIYGNNSDPVLKTVYWVDL